MTYREHKNQRRFGTPNVRDRQARSRARHPVDGPTRSPTPWPLWNSALLDYRRRISWPYFRGARGPDIALLRGDLYGSVFDHAVTTTAPATEYDWSVFDGYALGPLDRNAPVRPLLYHVYEAYPVLCVAGPVRYEAEPDQDDGA